MSTEFDPSAYQRGFETRLHAHMEKQAMLQGALRAAAPIIGGARRAISSGVQKLKAPTPVVPAAESMGPIASSVAGVGGKAGGPAGAAAATQAMNPGLLARGMGVATRNPGKALATTAGLASAGTAAGAYQYGKGQVRNMAEAMPKVVNDYMATQGAGPGVGGFMGKLLMLLQYLFGGQNAGKDLAGKVMQYGAQSPHLSRLNRHIISSVTPKAPAVNAQ